MLSFYCSEILLFCVAGLLLSAYVESANDETMISLHVESQLKKKQEYEVFRDIRYYFYNTQDNAKEQELSMKIISRDGVLRQYEYTNGDEWVIKENEIN